MNKSDIMKVVMTASAFVLAEYLYTQIKDKI